MAAAAAPIRAVVRIRGGSEGSDLFATGSKVALVMHRAGLAPETRSFEFDQVFPSDVPTAQVHTHAVAPLCAHVLAGRHALLLAVGEARSGKGMTLSGPGLPQGSTAELPPGVVQLALRQLCAGAGGDANAPLSAAGAGGADGGPEWRIAMQHTAMYHERPFDLLTGRVQPAPSSALEAPLPGALARGLSVVKAASLDELLSAYARSLVALQALAAEHGIDEGSITTVCTFTLRQPAPAPSSGPDATVGVGRPGGGRMAGIRRLWFAGRCSFCAGRVQSRDQSAGHFKLIRPAFHQNRIGAGVRLQRGVRHQLTEHLHQLRGLHVLDSKDLDEFFRSGRCFGRRFCRALGSSTIGKRVGFLSPAACSKRVILSGCGNRRQHARQWVKFARTTVIHHRVDAAGTARPGSVFGEGLHPHDAGHRAGAQQRCENGLGSDHGCLRSNERFEMGQLCAAGRNSGQRLGTQRNGGFEQCGRRDGRLTGGQSGGHCQSANGHAAACQSHPQQIAGLADAAIHRALADGQLIGDLLAGLTGKIGHHQHFTISLRQCVQLFVQHKAVLSGGNAIQRIVGFRNGLLRQ